MPKLQRPLTEHLLQFFTKLVQLYDYRKGADHGSISITTKRRRPLYPEPTLSPRYPEYILTTHRFIVTHGHERPAPIDAEPFPDLNPTTTYPVLVRATNDKPKGDRATKVKISTVLEAKDLDAFMVRLAEVCRAGMTGLKPRDRSRKKAKAKKRKVGGAS
jgi:signal recognition particle subunit SRP14